jgi:hypothetical protein
MDNSKRLSCQVYATTTSSSSHLHILNTHLLASLPSTSTSIFVSHTHTHNSTLHSTIYIYHQSTTMSHMMQLDTATYECWFCDSTWNTFSALLAHLEKSRCVKRDRIRTLAFECPEYGFYGNHLTDRNPFFCFCCQDQFPQISDLFFHAEQSVTCSYLLDDHECLGCLRTFYIDYYDCPGTDHLGY